MVCEGCGRDTPNTGGACSECRGITSAKRNTNLLGRESLPESCALAMAADEFGEDDYGDESDADSCIDREGEGYEAWQFSLYLAAQRDTSRSKRPLREWPYNSWMWEK